MRPPIPIRSLRCAYAALSLAALCSACSRQLDFPAPPSTTGFFAGRAVEPIAGTDQVQPVAGAIISVLGTNLHAVSDAQGSFSVGPLPVGSYRVLLTLQTSSGKARQRLLSGVEIQRGGATSTLGDVPLHQNAQVAGRALLDGAAKGNVGVSVFVPGTDFVSSTGDTGQYVLRDLPEGVVRIAAFRTGFQGAATTDLDVQGGALTTAVDLVLLPEVASPAPGSLHGTVVVLDGSNSGVIASAYRGSSTTPAVSVTTGEDGAFSLIGLPPDIYRLTFEKASYPPAIIPNLLVAANVSLKLNDPVVLSPFGSSNVGVDAGTTPPPEDAGTDAGTFEPDAGTIGAQCTTDNDCASGRLCVGTRCVGCSADADCRSGYVCRGQDCVRECTGNSECAQGLVCKGGVCAACGSNAECGDSSLVCLSGSCAHCRSGADCPAGRACLANGCGTCTADSQCDSGNLCVLGVCKPGTCHDNAGCPATQRCDPQTLSCTTCTADAQCQTGRLCLGAGVCTVANCRTSAECPSGQACGNNLCGACSSGAACAAGQVCDTGACHSGDCVTSVDCSGGQVCLNHSCSPCTSSTECGNGKVCSNNACVPGNCVTAATDCAAGQVCANNFCGPCGATADCAASNVVCDTGACVAGNCVNAADCPTAGQLCLSHTCSACTSSGQCGSGKVCSGGLCKAGNCTSNADCPATQTCDLNTLTCGACTADNQCSLGRLCLGSPGVCTVANCRSDTDCPTAQACVGNTCGACTISSQCRANQVCDTGACVPGDCLTTADCTGGKVCSNKFCVACANSPECGAGKVCAAGACVSGNCVSAAVDCAPGQICQNHVCSSCLQNTDCGASGYVCDNGSCVAGACVTENDCPAGKLCSAHQCVNCSATLTCGAGRVCASGLCKAGNCLTNGDCSNNQVCTNNNCSPCTGNADCAASGYVCVGGGCFAGNCVQTSDCSGGQICNTGSHLCVNCGGNGDCQSGQVCAAGKCVVGNCLAATDCKTAGNYNGQACLTNLCSACTADNQCPAGDLCYSGTCAPGNCKAASDCSNGQRLCAANGQGGKTCQACSPSGAQGGCPSGYLCDSGGFCQFGTCVDSTQCTSGKVCQNYQCQLCTAGTESLCPVATPICNTGTGACVAGNCHSNADCTATHNVCVNFSCAGNCVTNADCNIGSSSPYCNPSTHQCSPCTTSLQCGTGYVCTASSNGACVAGNCSFDVNCAAGQTCINNSCVQTAPAVGAGGTAKTTPEVAANSGGLPAVTSGTQGLYYSYSAQGAGQRQVALNSDMSVRWSKVITAASTSSLAGIVAPAPGLPGGEVFIANDGSGGGNHYGLRSDTGAPLWHFGANQAGAVGLAGLDGAGNTAAVPMFGWQNQGTPFGFNFVRLDGTGSKFVPKSCSNVGAPAWGRYVFYSYCVDGISAVDPVRGIELFRVAFPGGTIATSASAPAIWRKPGDTQEVLYFSGGVSSQPTKLWNLTVTDANAISGTPPTGYGQSTATISGGGGTYGPTLLDQNDLFGSAPPRVITASGGIITVSDGNLVQIANVTSPFANANLTLDSNGWLIGVSPSGNGSQLLAIRIIPNAAAPASATIQTMFSLPITPSGAFQSFAFPSAIATPGPAFGNLAIWALPSTQSTPSVWQFQPASGETSFLAQAPAWPTVGGDSGLRRVAPSYDCTSNANCPATQQCVLGSCIGVCRTGDDCTSAGSGLGCVLAQCGACASDASCPSGQLCSGGSCVPPPASGQACSVDLPACPGGQMCLHGACIPTPGPAATFQFPTFTAPSSASVGTDNTIYTVQKGSGSNLTVTAWDPATFSGPSAPSAYSAATTPAFAPVTVTTGIVPGLGPTATILKTSTFDTLYIASDTTNLFAIPGLNGGTGGSNFVTRSAVDGRAGATLNWIGGIAQGTSTVLDGVTPRPTLFSYAFGTIFAIDAQQATSGNGSLPAVWTSATGGSDNGGPVQVPLLIGSDGTIYHFHTNGTISAWDPNGNHNVSPTNGTYPGNRLWLFTAPTGWSGNVGGRPAIANVGGQDTLYFCIPSTNTLSMFKVSGSAPGAFTQTTVPCLIGHSILITSDGYALVSANTQVNLVSPAGVSVSKYDTSAISGSNFSPDFDNTTIGDDGVVYYNGIGSTNQYQLVALQLTANHTLSFLWQSLGVANSPFDGSFSFLLLAPPPSGTGPGHVIVDYPVGSGSARYWSSFNIGSTHGAATSGWPMQGGDYQHRNSLKTQ